MENKKQIVIFLFFMKRSRYNSYFFYTYRIYLLFLLIPFLQGCPYTSPYRLDSVKENIINETILGKWQGSISDELGNNRTINVSLSKKNDNEYDISVWGSFQKNDKKKKNTQDTIVGTAYLSYLANRQFMNIAFDNKYIIAEIKYDSDELSILPLDESFSSKIIRSDEQLKKAILYHYKSRLFPKYDESLSLKYMKRVEDPS